MKMRALGLAAVVGLSLCTAPVWADRGGMRGPGPGRAPNYAYSHSYDGHHFWGPFGFLVGATLLFSALQPRTVYYEPQVVYTPPVYYVPQPPIVQSYVLPADQAPASVYVVPPQSSPLPPPSAENYSNAVPGPGASGAQWWYMCKKPAGYYPYVKECPSGWEKVAPTPPDAPKN